MRVGLTLSGDLLNDDGAKFAAQLGVTRRRASPTITQADRSRHWTAIDPDEPIPDGMVWNMRYRDRAHPSLSRARV